MEAIDDLVNAAYSLASQSKTELYRIAAEATDYPSYATNVRAYAVGLPKPPKVSWALKITRLYPDVDLFKTWLEEWLHTRLKTWQSRSDWVDLKALISTSSPGKEPIPLVWAMTWFALACSAHAVAIPEGITMRDLPCLLEQVEWIDDAQRAFTLKQLRKKKIKLRKAEAKVLSLRAKLKVPRSGHKRSPKELDYSTDSDKDSEKENATLA